MSFILTDNIRKFPKNSEVFILGDINSLSAIVKEFLQRHSLKSCINKPTRVTPSSSTQIDVIFSNSRYISFSDVFSSGISDHDILITVRTLRAKTLSNKPKLINTRSFKNFNSAKFCEDLSNADWSTVINVDDIDIACDSFSKIINNISDKHAPVVSHRVSEKTSPWVTEELRKGIRERDFLKKKAARSRLQFDWNVFKSKRNAVNRLNKDLKTSYFNRKLLDNSRCSKKLWKALKDLLPNSKANSSTFCVLDGDKEITDNKDIANTFNNFFSTIGSKLAKDFTSTSSDINVPLNPNSFLFNRVTSKMVSKIISSLETGKATGPDDIGVKILKAGSPVISFYLCHIFNLSMSLGRVPKLWKTKRVSPLHKGGPVEDVNNYRPISILPVVMKVFEKLVYSQFYDFLISNSILCKCQSGFRSSHSTQTAITEVKEFILKRLEDKFYVGAVLIDLKKAFDTVDHQILLKKLFCYGFHDQSFEWIESYLSNRFQMTKFNDSLSDLVQEEAYGVPQGSVLGPLFFLIYINDISSVMSGFYHLYADDTIFIHYNKSKISLVSSLNNQMTSLSSWLSLNKLTLNLKKTEAIFFGDERKVKECKDLRVSLNGEDVENKEFVKYLGVYIDQKLDWKKHLTVIRGKGYNKLNQIKFLSNTLTPYTKTLLVNSLVIPYFNYCSTVWGSASQTNLNKISNLHKKSANLATKPLLSFSKLLYFNKSLLAFKIINNITPSYLLNKLKLVKQTHSYQTRSCSTNKIAHRLRVNKFSNQLVEHDITACWNNLPSDIRTTPSLLQFKCKLKKHLIE